MMNVTNHICYVYQVCKFSVFCTALKKGPRPCRAFVDCLSKRIEEPLNET